MPAVDTTSALSQLDFSLMNLARAWQIGYQGECVRPPPIKISLDLADASVGWKQAMLNNTVNTHIKPIDLFIFYLLFYVWVFHKALTPFK